MQPDGRRASRPGTTAGRTAGCDIGGCHPGRSDEPRSSDKPGGPGPAAPRAPPSRSMLLSRTTTATVEPFVANLAELWAADPATGRRRRGGSRTRPCTRSELARDGHADARPCPALTAPADRSTCTAATARWTRPHRLVADVDPERAVYHLIFGLGLGYHLEQLFDRVGDEAVFLRVRAGRGPAADHAGAPRPVPADRQPPRPPVHRGRRQGRAVRPARAADASLATHGLGRRDPRRQRPPATPSLLPAGPRHGWPSSPAFALHEPEHGSSSTAAGRWRMSTRNLPAVRRLAGPDHLRG